MSLPFTTLTNLINIYIYIVVVVGPVEMWKSHFTVESKRIVFHSPCGNHCGKLFHSVEKAISQKVFHISTALFFRSLWKCGKLEVKYMKAID
jgi:hypothetical protein